MMSGRLIATLFFSLIFACVGCGTPDAEIKKDALQTKAKDPVELAAFNLKAEAPKLETWTKGPGPIQGEGHEGSQVQTLIHPANPPIGADGRYAPGTRLALVQVGSDGSIWFMEKLDPGTNPESGDWFFGELNGEDWSVQGIGTEAQEACVLCHRYGAQGTDFVFSPIESF